VERVEPVQLVQLDAHAFQKEGLDGGFRTGCVCLGKACAGLVNREWRKKAGGKGGTRGKMAGILLHRFLARRNLHVWMPVLVS